MQNQHLLIRVCNHYMRWWPHWRRVPKAEKKPICIPAFVLMERCGYVLQPSRQQSELRAPSPRGLFFLSERSAVERVWLQAAFQWRYQISPIVTRHNEPSVRLAPPYYRRHPCEPWRDASEESAGRVWIDSCDCTASPAERMIGLS